MRLIAMVMAGAAVLAMMVPVESRAAGYSISEVDSKASGRGYAYGAVYDSPSAIFYNPANITRLDGLQLMVGVSAIMPRWQYDPVGEGETTQSDVVVSTPPSLSLTYNLGDVGLGTLATGFGIYLPYGSTYSWPDDWAGAQELREIALQVWEFAPALAWRPHEKFAIGGTFRILAGGVYLRRAVGFGDQLAGEVELRGTDLTFGGSGAISVWPMPGLSLGLTYRSGGEVPLSGESDFDFPEPFDTLALDRDARADLPLHHNFRFGVAYDVLPERLNVSADIEYQIWSGYEDLSVTFINEDGSTEELVQPRDASDAFVFHLGGELALSESFEIRAGYIFDQHILPERNVNPAPPDSNRHVVSLGASYYFWKLGVHAHFMNVFFVPRETATNDLPGEWTGGYPLHTMAYLYGISVSAAFDVMPTFGPSPYQPEAGE